MNNFYEPRDAVTTPLEVHSVALKLWHATSGVYIWEFLTTLDYEWAVIQGRLPYRWTIWIYSFTRVTGLLGLILCIAMMDITTPINCQLWTLFSVLFFCLSAITSSLLIVIRTIAIWNRDKTVLVVAITIWGANIAFHLQNIIRIRATWDPAQRACETVKTDPSLLSFLPAIISDVVLLLFVLAGLLVMRRGGASFGITRFLWKQGIIWLILGSVAEVPTLVLTFLHLNDPFHAMFETPGVIIMTIAATRMHRSLVNYASSNVIHETPQASGLVFAKTKQTNTSPTVPDQVEVPRHEAFGQHTKVSTSGGDSSTLTIFSTKSTLPAVSPSHSISETQSV